MTVAWRPRPPTSGVRFRGLGAISREYSRSAGLPFTAQTGGQTAVIVEALCFRISWFSRGAGRRRFPTARDAGRTADCEPRKACCSEHTRLHPGP
jgi:hypothetical protein